MDDMKVIDSKGKRLSAYLREVLANRHLMRTLALRDLKIRYAQTALGLLWTVIKPLTGLLIFSIFFGVLVQVDTGDVPYPLFAFAGLSAWYFFSFLVTSCGTALMNAQDIIRYLYFPKLILPLSKVLSGLVEFAVNLVIMFLMMIWYGYAPGWSLLALPLVILANAVLGFSVGLWFSALSIRRRDFQQVIPFVLNIGMWLSPVFYPSTMIPSEYEFVLFGNPVAGILAGYRWALLGGEVPDALYLLSLIPIIVLFVGGIWFFRRMEKEITDWV